MSLRAAVLRVLGASVILVNGGSTSVHSIYSGSVSITHSDTVYLDFFLSKVLSLVNMPTLVKDLPS